MNIPEPTIKNRLIFGVVVMSTVLPIALMFSRPRTMEEQERYEAAQAQAKVEEQKQIDQRYKDRMDHEYMVREVKSWSGTANNRRDFQLWRNEHVRADGSIQ
jgi:hypothetical protein